MTLADFHIGFPYLESMGQKIDQRRIGLSVRGWRLKADFQAIAVDSRQLRATGTRLDMTGEHETSLPPAIMPGHEVRYQSQSLWAARPPGLSC